MAASSRFSRPDRPRPSRTLLTLYGTRPSWRRHVRPASHRARNTLVGLLLLAMLAVGLGAAGLAAGAVLTVNSMQQGLPDPTRLDSLSLAQPTSIYDSSGTVKLATFQEEFRRVVSYGEIPKFLLDATTTAEDRTYWTNGGVDPGGIAGALIQDFQTGNDTRGASTITQQLVRAVLLPPDVVAPTANQYVRKMKEIIQAVRLTDAYPGEAGKQKIITAYLNDVFYGHGAYGVAAAAQTYFGVKDLSRLTLAQAALLAGLVKSPTTLDPYNFAKKGTDGELVVPATADPVVRRNYILSNIRQFGRWTKPTAAEIQAAIDEPVVLTPSQPQPVKAPQFVAQVRSELQQILGSSTAVDTGGYRVVTSLDYNAQTLAEKWVGAAAIIPNLPAAKRDQAMKALKLSGSDASWLRNITGSDLHNGALVAMDYRTGDVLAYVGSAGYYRSDLASPQFDPQFDVAAAPRQPGSAWKPIMYSTGFDQKVIDPGTLLIDASTQFGPGYAPHDADFHERGPVLARKALQYSLNIPAIQAYSRVGSQAVTATAQRMGIHFLGGPDALNMAGYSGAIGTVEVPLLDMVSAYGAFPNGGVANPPQFVREIDGPNGKVVWKAPAPKGTQAISAQSAFLISNILEGNTDPNQNLLWGPQFFLDNGPNGKYRPAALKTGTTDQERDLTTFGFLAPPADPKAPGLAVGVWIGNSDHSAPRGNVPIFAVDDPAHVWHSFVRDYSNGWPVTDFSPPQGVVKATIDAWSGGQPGPWTRQTTNEWFIQGTEPGSSHPIDPPGALYTRACGTWAVDTAKAEVGPAQWVNDARNWMVRAARGRVAANSETPGPAYFWGRSGWGGPLVVQCSGGRGAPGSGFPQPTPAPTPSPTATPTPAPSPTPQVTPTPQPTPQPTPSPTFRHRPGPTPTPVPSAGAAAQPTQAPLASPTLAAALGGGLVGPVGASLGLEAGAGLWLRLRSRRRNRGRR